MFPHEYISILHFWQEYHLSKAVFFSLLSVSGTQFNFVHSDNFDHLIKGDILRLCKHAFPHLTLTHWFSIY